MTSSSYKSAAGQFKRDHISKSCMPLEGEEVWRTICARPGFKPYAKLMWSTKEGGYRPVLSGYMTGDECIERRGIDLRYGWDPSGERLKGVVGLGNDACWGHGFPNAEGKNGVHGGVFHSILDEITAEVVKYSKVPRILTSSASIQLKHPLFVGDYAEIEARVTKTQGLLFFLHFFSSLFPRLLLISPISLFPPRFPSPGMRIFTEGKLFRGKTLIATGEFVLVDMEALEQATGGAK